MRIDDVLSAILIGLVVGTLARLVLPGKQSIGILATWLIGFGGALAGSWAAKRLGVSDDARAALDWNSVNWHFSWSWAELAIQVAVAVIGVAIVAAVARPFYAYRETHPRRARRSSHA
ncbi:GlsB/YeaQ/YmgE family stress response membrane protein [Hamadaea sp. NPDC050747]|uniref:GlsB/YeaQ/YmgE family stress response membrane protein n=1 Tax=Hamadaea sp. NPDC050747 TaxID=3155789 RepID=UPI00340B4702